MAVSSLRMRNEERALLILGFFAFLLGILKNPNSHKEYLSWTDLFHERKYLGSLSLSEEMSGAPGEAATTSIARSRSRSADGEHTLLREKSGERLLAVACLMCPTSLLSPPCSEPARLRLKRDQPGSFANRWWTSSVGE